MTTSDVFAATTTTTSNYYKNPVFNKDPGDPGEPTTGKWSFRGFEEVTTTGATGAKTVQRFGYGNLLSPDWSGRLTTTFTKSAETPTAVVSISETQWSQQVTGAGYIVTYHPLAESKWTCKNGQDESTCRGDPSTFSKNSTTYEQLPAAGNQTKRTYAAGNVSWDYVYDGEEQLRRVTKRTGTTVNGSEEYWYDENGGRLAIVYRDPAGLKTGLRWFIGGTEAYYTASGTGNNVATLTKAYTHPTLGTPVARVERTPTAVKIEYQFHGLGSNTLAAVGSDGVTNASFMYAPYGEVVEATDGGAGVGNGKDAHRRRITDKYTDEIGGLMYYGARYYDGVLLGWTQGDPLYRFAPDAAWATPRKGLLYQYVLGNPVRYVDPDGRDVGIEIVATNRSTRLNFDFGNTVVAVELTSQQVNPTSEASKTTVAGKTWVLASFETGGYEEGVTSVGLSTVTGLIPVVRNSPIHWGVQAADDLYEDIYTGNYEERGDITTVDPASLGRGGGPALGKTPGKYNRRQQYGTTPTKADRKAIGAGSGQVADHDPPLVKRWYEGDPKTGEPPGYTMTPAQRRASAADRSRMKTQSKQDSNKQGGEMSAFSKLMKKIFGL